MDPHGILCYLDIILIPGRGLANEIRDVLGRVGSLSSLSACQKSFRSDVNDGAGGHRRTINDARDLGSAVLLFLFLGEH